MQSKKQLFIDRFVANFLASYVAYQYHDISSRGGWIGYKPPVEDAKFLANTAWEELKKFDEDEENPMMIDNDVNDLMNNATFIEYKGTDFYLSDINPEDIWLIPSKDEMEEHDLVKIVSFDQEKEEIVIENLILDEEHDIILIEQLASLVEEGRIFYKLDMN